MSSSPLAVAEPSAITAWSRLETRPLPRVLGAVRGERPGPTLLVVAGLHGNEPAGVEAALRVLPILLERAASVRGEVVILVGNRAALAAARRFVGRDLNRAWFDRRGQDVASPSQLPSEPEEPAHPEDREQRELLIEIEAAVARARGTILVLDLHTFSGRGCAFTTASDSLPERDFATAIPVPTILGLDEMVTGTLLSYLHQRGYVTAGFESGRHDEPAAIDRAEAGLWIAIVAAGCLRSNHAPEARAGRRRLEVELSGLRRVFEMSHRHAVAPGDGFRMRPGFENLQPVAAGTILAEDHRGLIAAPRSGRVLMPLYQEQGEDGFFLVREVPRWRRLVARALRRRSLRRRS